MNLVAAVFVFFAFLADIVSTSAQQIGEIILLHCRLKNCYVFLKKEKMSAWYFNIRGGFFEKVQNLPGKPFLTSSKIWIKLQVYDQF